MLTVFLFSSLLIKHNIHVSNEYFFLSTFLWRFLYFLNDTQYNLILFFYLFFILTKKKFKPFFFLSLFFIFYTKLDIIPNNIFYDLTWVINNNLTNGFCLVHPLLVYFLYIYVLQFISKKYNFGYYWFMSKNNIKIILISATALLLGSWWAQQELNWGGWWNWDFVELILFIFLLKMIILVHIDNFASNIFTFMSRYVFFFYLIIFFLFVRWDILNSVHSFNVLNFFEKYIIYISIFLLLFILLYTYYLIKQFFLFDNYFYFTKKNKKITYVNLFLNIFIYIILIFFFYNVKLTIFKETQYLENVFFLKFLLIFFTTLSFLFLRTLNINLLIIVVLPIISFFQSLNFWLFLNFFFKNYSFKVKYIHLCILLFLVFFTLVDILDFYFYTKVLYLNLNSIITINNIKTIEDVFYNNITAFINNTVTLNTDLIIPVAFFNIRTNGFSFFLSTNFNQLSIYTYIVSLKILMFLFLLFLTSILNIIWEKKNYISY